MKLINNILGIIGAFLFFSPVYFIYGITFLLTWNRKQASQAVEDFFDSWSK